jgi:hypothetical protein
MCGRAESEKVAERRSDCTKLQSGVYTRCQIAAWADEQWLASSEATSEDASRSDGLTCGASELPAETALVPARFCRPVPWFYRACVVWQ